MAPSLCIVHCQPLHSSSLEVEAALNDEETKAWLDAMDLQVSDLEELFIVFDDGDGKISLDESTPEWQVEDETYL
eukprot:4381574-Amphidinium_carterae.1